MKRPFDIDLAVERVREAIRPFPPAVLFELAERGFDSPFEILVACILSIRTRDEVTLPCALRLLALARTPDAMSQLAPETLERTIRECTFPETKAKRIAALARRVVTEQKGKLPCDEAFLRSCPGVGPKCTNLVLGIACNQPRIGVDIHVHRVMNRWGYVQGKTPEQTLKALEAKLPQKYWVEINRLLVPFGKHICKGSFPQCSLCPLEEMCPQVGVRTRPCSMTPLGGKAKS